MFKRLLIGVAVGGGIAYFVKRKLGGSGYDEDDIDSADWGDFGDRGAPAPEQQMSPAETRTGVNATELSEAARIEASTPDILKEWPAVSQDDVKSAGGDREKLAATIAEKAGAAAADVKTKLDEIIARATPLPSYPAL